MKTFMSNCGQYYFPGFHNFHLHLDGQIVNVDHQLIGCVLVMIYWAHSVSVGDGLGMSSRWERGGSCFTMESLTLLNIEWHVWRESHMLKTASADTCIQIILAATKGKIIPSLHQYSILSPYILFVPSFLYHLYISLNLFLV